MKIKSYKNGLIFGLGYFLIVLAIVWAEGKAEAIELENKALLEWFKGNAIDFKKLETAERALDKGTKYVLGTDKDVQLVLSEAAGITPIEKKKRK